MILGFRVPRIQGRNRALMHGLQMAVLVRCCCEQDCDKRLQLSSRVVLLPREAFSSMAKPPLSFSLDCEVIMTYPCLLCLIRCSPPGISQRI